jgi:hypothetical protein
MMLAEPGLLQSRSLYRETAERWSFARVVHDLDDAVHVVGIRRLRRSRD